MFNDGWPDNYGPEWFAWQQEAARLDVALRKLMRDMNSEVQFDYEREADQQGVSVRSLFDVKHQSSAGGNPRL